MIRRRRFWSLIAATLLLSGCPGSWMLPDDSDNSNILPTMRGSSGGGVTFSGGTSSSSGGGTAFSCLSPYGGSGTLSDGPGGVNPSSVSLADPVKVMPLYLGGNVSMSVSNARTAWVSLASLQESSLSSMQTAWSGSGVSTAYQTQSGASSVELPQDRVDRLVREQLKSLRPAPVPTTYRAQAGVSYAVGNDRTFKILDFNGGAPRSVATKAAYVYNAPSGQKGSFVIWVDAEDQAIFQGSGSKLQTIATELRDHIYQTDTCAFGADTSMAENNALPGTKQILLADDYVHFVFSHRVDSGTLTSGDGTLGFFTLADLADPSYNQGKILYIASSATSRSLGDMFAVIAHEFQHLLFSCHRVKAVGMQNHIYEFNSGADTWLNEGMAMLAMMLNGYGPDGAQPSPAVAYQIAQFLETPSQFSMTGFFGDNNTVPDAYGMVALFAQYLDDRLGDAALKEFHTTDNTSTMFNGQGASMANASTTDLAERVLAKHNTSLGQMFTDFGAAVLLDGTPEVLALGEPLASRYQIRNVNLRGTYAGLQQTPIVMAGPHGRSTATSALALKPYSLTYLAQTNLTGMVSLGFSNASAGTYGAKLVLTK